MSSTPSNPRTFAANTGLGISSKLTPSNSPYPRTPRSPYKPRNFYESGLSLKRIIGTTVSSPTAFDSLSSSRIFAYTAGAAAVVVNVDDTSKYSQRFFRARPTAVPLNSAANATLAPSTPTNTANDSRNRAVAALRDSAVPFSPSTPHTSLEWGDSPTSKTWTSRERIKAATCLSISRDGKFLAVGETGYSPRVLIFSLQDTSSDIPLSIQNEHTYGVRAVSFSPDGKYLASLGSPNDGFLYVWSINQRTGAAKLHSSNKCTSFVKQMIWLGSSIITIGTRHIKIWRVEDPRSASPTKQRFALDGTPLPVAAQPALKTLTGRNVLLGPLVEATFTTLAAISEHKAIVCSEKGDVCLLDDSEGQKLMKLANTGFAIACIAVDMEARRVRIGGRYGKVKSICLDDLLTPSTPPESPTPMSESVSGSEAGHICAMGYAARSLITVDSKHLIEISKPDSDLADPQMSNTPFPAHGDSVLGVRLLSPDNEMKAAFLTWSANGTIVFWDLDGSAKASLTVEVEQLTGGDDEINQCQVVRASKGAIFLVTGDKYGVLRVINPVTQKCTFDARAHMSDIQDIALHESGNVTLIASCSRDRTIQLFRLLSEQWVLIQTLDEHSASVSSLFFAENGEKLISCSTDRTIHVRQLVKKEVGGQDVIGAVPTRIITLKASPVSMAACFADQMGNFVVSLLDRTVATYEISSGRLIHSFRATDSEGQDAVVLDALVMGRPSTISGRPTILAGVSSTDKSVRIYDGSTGSFLDREWGHTASVTDVALLEVPDSEQKTLISTGSDGTIMIWDLSPRPQEPEELAVLSINRDPSPPKDTPSTRPPLRRVLSRAELAEFQRASPLSTPTGNRSPPRIVRRKTSRYGLSSQSPTLAIPPVPSVNSKHFVSASDDSSIRRSTRHRSRSPPQSPKAKDMRRPSLASVDTRSRTKSAGNGNFSEFGTLNMATEQACRTLRAYRKKLLSSETVKEEALKELDQELRLTAMALGEKSLKSKAISETVLTGLLDQYSERLVSMFDEKLRLARVGSEEPELVEEKEEERERPKTAGPVIESSHSKSLVSTSITETTTNQTIV
ncbi:probable transcriptional repressor rco-1 [Phialocephala subalpina]|uniref:Probable transcriptional repressor rco-1 n=1 Tax=Phialocephala subalpina TaxID=576137 RepID=A0A1L7WJ10_9HELO|nr:probable transcriptional repressor rco-1 [Phialocephala subalpina]